MFLSLPKIESTEFLEGALNLSHELGHQALNLYQCGDKIFNSDIRRPTFSVVRRTFRPAILSFHATVATVFMIEFLMECWQPLGSRVSPEYLQTRFRGLLSDLEQGAADMTGQQFTPLGKMIANQILEVMLAAKRFALRMEGGQDVANA